MLRCGLGMIQGSWVCVLERPKKKVGLNQTPFKTQEDGVGWEGGSRVARRV